MFLFFIFSFDQFDQHFLLFFDKREGKKNLKAQGENEPDPSFRFAMIVIADILINIIVISDILINIIVVIIAEFIKKLIK